MKQIIIAISFALLGTLVGTYAQAQNGLENIIVEKYYVSNAADATGSTTNGGGTLPVGSVTYRIFADLLPGYKFQATYGVAGHPLVLTSTTSFFNNEDRGNTQPNWTKAQAADNSVMLDSYFSVGGATSVSGGELGILKSEDNATANIVNTNGMLANADASAGLPLTSRDGFITGTVPTLNFVGFTTELDVFGALSQVGGSFTTSNGSIACLNGAQGPFPAGTNRVFIGQFTTTGIFHYELNIQTISPTNVVQKFVASNPTGAEISIASLSGTLGATSAAEPTTVGAIAFGATTSNSIIANFTSGNGAKRIVLAKAGSAVNSNPVDGNTYVANATFGSGIEIGIGNYVVYNGTGNTVSLAGLTPGTTYYFAVYEYNDNNQAGAENYKTAGFVTGSKITLTTGTTYTWNQITAGTYSYGTATNWTPNRVSPATNDILVFSNAAAGTIVNNVTPQTIGQLLVQNNSSIQLQGNSTTTLTIAGNTSADDFRVDAGSTLTFSGFTPLSIVIGNGATANIYGNIISSSQNTINATNASALKFKSGSSFTTNTGISNAPFGSTGTTSNSVVFESGSTFNQNSSTLANPFQLVAPASIVQFQAGSNQVFTTASGLDVEGRTYANLTIGAAVSIPTFTTTLNVGGLTINSGASFNLTGTGTSTVNIAGDITNNSNLASSISVGTGGINLTKVGTQIVGGTGSGALSFLATAPATTTIVTACTLALGKTATFNNLTINGKLQFNAANVTCNINGAIATAGQILPFGTYDASFYFKNTVGGSLGSLGTTGVSVKNITIDRPGQTLTLLANVAAYGAITITTGNLASNGFLTLKSIAGRTAYISGDGSASVIGNITAERYIAGLTGYPQHFLSVPVSASGLTTNLAWSSAFLVLGTFPYTSGVGSAAVKPTVWTYNEAISAGLERYQSANTVAIAPFKGYLAQTASNLASTLKVTGTANNGSYSIPLTKLNSGTNLVGNPYPSPISWNALRALSGQANLFASYVGYNATTKLYGTFNGTIGTNGVTDTIASSQGFLVYANASGNLIADNTIRKGSTTAVFLESSVTPTNIIKLNLEGNNSVEQIAIYSAENGSDKYNANRDGLMFEPVEAKLVDVYVSMDDKKLAIKELSENIAEQEIELGTTVTENGVYTFKVAEFSNFAPSITVSLLDKQNNISTKLSGGKQYGVVLNAGDNNGRFYLNYSNTTTSVDDLSNNNGIQCYSANGILSLINNDESSVINIVMNDMSGKEVLVKQVNANKGITEVSLPTIAKGIYSVHITGKSFTSTKKISIN